MKFTVAHPSDPKTRAEYGWDRHIQFFVVVYRGEQVIADYDLLTPGYGHLAGAIKTLVQHEFFEDFELALALQQLPHMEEPSDLDSELRLAGEVLINFRLAAA